MDTDTEIIYYKHTSQYLDSRRKLCIRLQLKCDGKQWRKVGEVKGKLANG